MKILFVTNYYSPAKYGWGYRQLCEEVADGLAARGHEIAVLTSTHRDGDEIPHRYPVHRLLHIEPDWEEKKLAAWSFFVGRRKREAQALTHFKQLVSNFKPDIIFVWHAIGLPKLILREAECSKDFKVAYYLADYQPEHSDEYMIYWRENTTHWLFKLFKRPLAKLALYKLAKEEKPIYLNYDNVICVSNYVRQRLVSQRLISENAVVIHNGVDLSKFSQNSQADKSISSSNQLKCLVAGRIVPEKGVHTVVEGFALLNSSTKHSNLTLTILGDGPTYYCEQLYQKIRDNNLQDIVEFCSPVPREQMPDVLSKYDIFILSSEYDEPLARALQEGMAMGLLIVGTVTGGSGELLVHEKNGLVFEAGNPRSLADQLSRVLNEPHLVTDLAKSGKKEVVERFDINRTVKQIEQYLLGLTNE